MGRKFGLLIGNSTYEDSALAQLKAPPLDVASLAEVLRSPNIGGFEAITTLVENPHHKIRREIALFFKDKKPDDLLLLYFSGHGVLDEEGHLYLAAADTERGALRATAVEAAFVNGEMNLSRSQRKVLVLDCCHSGAFARGRKGPGASVETGTRFGGTGRVVLTASDAVQYAWEGDRVMGHAENSVFTHYLIEGLRTGEADLDGDESITIDELYEYVYEQVMTKTPTQTPQKSVDRQQGGAIIIARSPVVRPARLPPELLQLVENPFTSARTGAVEELARLMRGSHRGLAQAAHRELKRLIDEDDSLRVRDSARRVLQGVEDKLGAGNEESRQGDQALESPSRLTIRSPSGALPEPEKSDEFGSVDSIGKMRAPAPLPQPTAPLSSAPSTPGVVPPAGAVEPRLVAALLEWGSEWRIWLQWAFANSLAWIVGWFASTFFVSLGMGFAFAGFAGGGAAGTTRFGILRWVGVRNPWWMWSFAAAWWGGFYWIGDTRIYQTELVLVGAVAGIACGLLELLALRQGIGRSLQWVLVTSLGWGVAWFLVLSLSPPMVSMVPLPSGRFLPEPLVLRNLFVTAMAGVVASVATAIPGWIRHWRLAISVSIGPTR